MKRILTIVLLACASLNAQEHQSGKLGLGFKRYLSLSSGQIDVSGWAAGSLLAFRSSGVLVDTTYITLNRVVLGDTSGFVLTAPGAATVSTKSNVILDTAGGAAADTAVTLTGVIGQVVYISTRVDARDIRFLDAGNFTLGGERLLDDADDVLVLKATSATTWKEVSFISNN